MTGHTTLFSRQGVKRFVRAVGLTAASLLVMNCVSATASPGHISSGHAVSAGGVLSPATARRAVLLGLPSGARGQRGRVGRPAGAPVVTRSSADARGLTLPSRLRGIAHGSADYSGPQSPFPITSEGYLPLKQYLPQVGRFYAISQTEVGMCTATLVAPNVVVTAANCVWNSSTGRFWPKYAFVPQMHGSARPYGTWWARSWHIWSNYETAPSESIDYAFVKLYPQNGRNLGKITGWRGILLNSSAHSILSLGYPASGVFAAHCGISSCIQWECSSPLGRIVQDNTGSSEVGMGCNSGEGSSGGPWFEQYNGAWYVASNVSTGITFLPDPGYSTNQWGPYYDNSTLNLYNWVKTHG
jgi:V8-like Glu-specific endopeptidase